MLNLSDLFSQSSPFWGEFVGKIYLTWNPGDNEFR